MRLSVFMVHPRNPPWGLNLRLRHPKGKGLPVKNKGLLTTAVVALVVVIGYDYAKAKGMGKR